MTLSYLKFWPSYQEKRLDSFLSKSDGFRCALKMLSKWSNQIFLESIHLLGNNERKFTFSCYWFTNVLQVYFFSIWFASIRMTRQVFTHVDIFWGSGYMFFIKSSEARRYFWDQFGRAKRDPWPKGTPSSPPPPLPGRAERDLWPKGTPSSPYSL